MPFINNRIRRLPIPTSQSQSYFSVSSRDLPPGTLLIHELKAEKETSPSLVGDPTPTYFCSSCMLYNLHQVLLLKNFAITDHGWALLPSSHNERSDPSQTTDNLYLAALTRSHGSGSALQSFVDIYCANSVLLDQNIAMSDELNPKISPVYTLNVPSFSTSLCLGGNFLALSTTVGVHVYRLSDFISETRNYNSADLHQCVLLPFYSAHACTISFPMIAVASSDRIGVWNLESLHTSPPIASWSTTLAAYDINCRCTSISFSGDTNEFLGTTFMNGSVFVYQFDQKSSSGKEIWYDCVENSVDNMMHPTFGGFIPLDMNPRRTGFVFSTPGTILLRVVDLQLLEEKTALGHDSTEGNVVLGLLTGINPVLWMDEKMNLHGETAISL